MLLLPMGVPTRAGKGDGPLLLLAVVAVLGSGMGAGVEADVYPGVGGAGVDKGDGIGAVGVDALAARAARA